MNTLPSADLVFEEETLRIRDVDGNPWFVLVDVCRVLGIKNSRDVASRLDADEKGVVLTYTLRGEQEVMIVSEPAALQIIMRSDAAIKPGTRAYRFRRWVTHEVLPSIRKYGWYDPARAAAMEQTRLLPAPAQKTKQERMLLEIARYEERTGYRATDIPGLSKNKIKQIELGASIVAMLSRNQLWATLVSCGFDMPFILFGRTNQAGGATTAPS